MAITDVYIKGPVLGKGTFGEVIMATHRQSGQIVAIKKIRVGEKGEGVNVTALREVKFLRELHHPHIMSLLDVIPLKKGLALVFQYMESDLETMIKDRSLVLSAADVKSYMLSILEAVKFCHERWVVHRDIKPNNFLVSEEGTLHLADFGLSRVYGSPERRYTNQVFARWYRAPELLFGSTCYGPGVDMWAVGCVFAELLLRRPWFPGESDIEVLTKIFGSLGTPKDAEWAGLRHMPGFIEFSPVEAPPLRQIFKGVGDDALDLLSRMVSLDARRRISAADALKHRYFRVDPAPTPIGKLPRPHKREFDNEKGKESRKRQANDENGNAHGQEGGTKRRRPDSADTNADKSRDDALKLDFDDV